jgi:hypothetical protein
VINSLTITSNTTGRSPASELLHASLSLPTNHDRFAHIVVAHAARTIVPIPHTCPIVLHSIARRYRYHFPEADLPFRFRTTACFFLMYHHLFSCIAGRMQGALSFVFPYLVPLPLMRYLLVRLQILKLCDMILMFSRVFSTSLRRTRTRTSRRNVDISTRYAVLDSHGATTRCIQTALWAMVRWDLI